MLLHILLHDVYSLDTCLYTKSSPVPIMQRLKKRAKAWYVYMIFPSALMEVEDEDETRN